MASQNMERRGVGLNRSIHALLQNCQLQQCADVKKRNQICLQEKLYSELYTSPTSGASTTPYHATQVLVRIAWSSDLA